MSSLIKFVRQLEAELLGEAECIEGRAEQISPGDQSDARVLRAVAVAIGRAARKTLLA